MSELRWGTGYGSRRHIVNPEPAIERRFGRDVTVWLALCSSEAAPTALDFIADDATGLCETWYGPVDVMRRPVCKKCQRIDAQRLSDTEENQQ